MMNRESLGRPRLSPFTVVLAVTSLLLIIGIYTPDQIFMEFESALSKNSSTLMTGQNMIISPITHRKLLNDAEGKRIWRDRCSISDIVIVQSPAGKLPDGKPAFLVEIINLCISGCDISDIHLSCGWFSSIPLVDPHILKRHGFDNCLINDGKPLRYGQILSFKYYTNFPFPLAVTSVRCR